MRPDSSGIVRAQPTRWQDLPDSSYYNPDRGFSNWYRSRTGNQLRAMGIAGRLFSIILDGICIGLAVWIVLLLRPTISSLYIFAIVCPSITVLFTLFYLLPAACSDRVPGAGPGKKTPFIVDLVAIALWFGTWAAVDDNRMRSPCSTQQLCDLRTGYLAVGIVEFTVFCAMALHDYIVGFRVLGR